MRPVRTAKCDCQWDAHFERPAIAGTFSHAYHARVPTADLRQVATFPKTGTPVMKCGPCRESHMLPVDLVAQLNATKR